MSRTKIVATLGPASDSPEMIQALLEGGVDLFRLNFSHGDLERHAAIFGHIRRIARERQSASAVMADLCGPKVRVDPVQEGGVPIVPGHSVDIVAEHVIGTPERISTNRPQLVHEIRRGHRVLIDDGAIRLRAAESSAGTIRCVCEVGGVIHTRKGVNLPDTTLDVPSLTAADQRSAEWARVNQVDYVALSFVRSAADLADLRTILGSKEPRPHVVAKIETPHAVNHLEEIIAAADAVLVARGDLGVEVDLAEVPLLQKRIVRLCQQAGKPVIVATQMLQSMVELPTATRAEVSDVANAVLEGADAVMLSAETSIGKHPLAAVRLMDHIAATAEPHACLDAGLLSSARSSARSEDTLGIVRAAEKLARESAARAVVVWTRSGNTARLLSKCRLSCPVVGLSPDETVCRRMALYYGTQPMQFSPNENVAEMLASLSRLLIEAKLAEPGDRIVVVAGSNLRRIGFSNFILLHRLALP